MSERAIGTAQFLAGTRRPVCAVGSGGDDAASGGVVGGEIVAGVQSGG